MLPSCARLGQLVHTEEKGVRQTEDLTEAGPLLWGRLPTGGGDGGVGCEYRMGSGPQLDKNTGVCLG